MLVNLLHVHLPLLSTVRLASLILRGGNIHKLTIVCCQRTFHSLNHAFSSVYFGLNGWIVLGIIGLNWPVAAWVAFLIPLHHFLEKCFPVIDWSLWTCFLITLQLSFDTWKPTLNNFMWKLLLVRSQVVSSTCADKKSLLQMPAS